MVQKIVTTDYVRNQLKEAVIARQERDSHGAWKGEAQVAVPYSELPSDVLAAARSIAAYPYKEEITVVAALMFLDLFGLKHGALSPEDAEDLIGHAHTDVFCESNIYNYSGGYYWGNAQTIMIELGLLGKRFNVHVGSKSKFAFQVRAEDIDEAWKIAKETLASEDNKGESWFGRSLDDVKHA